MQVEGGNKGRNVNVYVGSESLKNGADFASAHRAIEMQRGSHAISCIVFRYFSLL